MGDELKALIEKASSHKMTPAERFEQRVSFVYSGVCETTTREEVRARLAEEYGDPVAYEARIAELEALSDRLLLEAQGHAQEARTANATIAEIYQVVSGGEGEPGNWHGASPVRTRIAAFDAEIAEKDARIAALEEEAERLREALDRASRLPELDLAGHHAVTISDAIRALAQQEPTP